VEEGFVEVKTRVFQRPHQVIFLLILSLPEEESKEPVFLSPLFEHSSDSKTSYPMK
jgi:hypothetical protein